jgi:pentatricopeptide repeat protein
MVYTFGAVMDVCASAAQLDKALEVAEAMELYGLKLNKVSIRARLPGKDLLRSKYNSVSVCKQSDMNDHYHHPSVASLDIEEVLWGFRWHSRL